VGDELLFDKIPRQLDALCLVQLAGDGEFDLPGELSIFPLLGRLDRIPQSFAFAELFGSVVQGHHFGVGDTGLAREIMVAVETPVIEPGS
jgi:hypothetical protein